jgi:hypothetical protein
MVRTGRCSASIDPGAELLAKRPHARWRDRDRTGAFVSYDPFLVEAAGADRRAERAGQVRPPGRPIDHVNALLDQRK